MTPLSVMAALSLSIWTPELPFYVCARMRMWGSRETEISAMARVHSDGNSRCRLEC